MKKIIIELEQKWVLEHRTDDVLPVALLKANLEKVDGVKVDSASHTGIAITVDENTCSAESVLGMVKDWLKGSYPQENVDNVLSSKVSDVEIKENTDNTDNADNTAAQDDEAVLQDLTRRLRERDEEVRRAQQEQQQSAVDTSLASARSTEKPDEVAELLKEIDALVGAAEFKALAHEIALVAPQIKSKHNEDLLLSQSYLISIGDGCGLTTYLGLFARLLTLTEICPIDHNRHIIEIKFRSEGRRDEPEVFFKEVNNALDKGDSRRKRILMVDVSEWLNKENTGLFKEFLRKLDQCSSEFVYFFRIPFVEKNILESSRCAIGDMLYTRALSIAPLNNDEIVAFAAREITARGYTVQKSAWQYFNIRIAEEKRDGKFYGPNTVKKVVKELLYKKELTNAQKKRTGNVITAADMRKLCEGEYVDDTMSAEEMLDSLVGIDKIKDRIMEMISQITLSAKSGAKDRPCIHMRFLGNPGTGKTTVARIVGKMLKERGVLRIGAFHEHAGRDLCGRYVGETAPKTAGICRDAYGSVLFIDEAYSLYKEHSSADYGTEALDTLIAEMENHRDDMVVIMAGYTDEMERLMNGNRGLASRMPYVIEFPNFTQDELYRIFMSMVGKKFKYDADLPEVAKRFFDKLPDELVSSKDFSNARYARNLFERTWAKAAMRCQLDNRSEVILTVDDFERASGEGEFGTNKQNQSKMGF